MFVFLIYRDSFVKKELFKYFVVESLYNVRFLFNFYH